MTACSSTLRCWEGSALLRPEPFCSKPNLSGMTTGTGSKAAFYRVSQPQEFQDVLGSHPACLKPGTPGTGCDRRCQVLVVTWPLCRVFETAPPTQLLKKHQLSNDTQREVPSAGLGICSPTTSLSLQGGAFPPPGEGCRPGDRSFSLGWGGVRAPAGPGEPHLRQCRVPAGRWPSSNGNTSPLATSTSNHLGPSHCVSCRFMGCWQGAFFIAVPFPAGTMLAGLAAAALPLPAWLHQWMPRAPSPQR